jgi:hypothetical protein
MLNGSAPMLKSSAIVFAIVLLFNTGACSSTSEPVVASDSGTGDAAAANLSYCEQEGAYIQRCNTSAPPACLTDLKANCGERDRYYSEAFKTAYAQCASATICVGFVNESSCGRAALKAQPPTPAQQKLADDLCSACANAPSIREEGLSCQGHVVTGEGRRLGTHILSLSDSAAATVTAKCIAPAKQQYPNDYSNCENVFMNCIGDQIPIPASCE